MTMSRYAILILVAVTVFAYTPKVSGGYETTTIGATIGGVAGTILSSGTPLGLIGGIVIGGFVGNKMESEAADSESVATLRQDKSLKDKS